MAVRLGSLTAAATRLAMSPAMAAKHMNALEERLGTQLIRRTTRRLSLTEAGTAYLEKAEQLVSELGELEAEISAKSVSLTGLLRISAPVTFSTLYLAELIVEFRQLYPGVQIELGLSDRFVDLLEERWDLAIRIGRLADSSLVARKLCDARLCLTASPGYLRSRGMPRSLEDLPYHNCLGDTLASQSTGFTWRFGKNGEQKVAVDGTVFANNGEILAAVARSDAGLLYGPRFIVASSLRDGSLVEIDLGVELLELGGIYAVSHSRRRQSPKARAWIDFVAQRLHGSTDF
jgi:DNA-binding transcriptional LysR family regulator